MNEELTQREIDLLKAHLGLCVQLFRAVADQAGLDLNGCSMEISLLGNSLGRKSIGEMVKSWEEMSK